MDGLSLKALLRATAVLSAIVSVPSIGWADCVSLSQTLARRFEDNTLLFVADVLGVDAVLEPFARVLVYAGGPHESVSTSCSGTRVVGADDPEVQQLRKLASARE